VRQKIKRSSLLWRSVVFLLAFPVLGMAQDKDSGSGFKPGLGYEYFSQTIGWDDLGTERTSNLRSGLFTLVLGYKAGPGLSLAGIVGYSSSNFGGLVFRHLPFSIEIQTGGTDGILLGGELTAMFFGSKGFRLGVIGQYLAYFSSAKTFDLPGLAVSGDAEAQPSWTRVVAGPIISFGRSGIRPYLYPNVRHLKGKFRLREEIQSLKGEENKTLTGRGLFGLAAGAEMSLSEKFSLRAEAGISPHKDGNDFTVNLRTVFGF